MNKQQRKEMRRRFRRERRVELSRRSRAVHRQLVAARKALRRREFLIGAAGAGAVLAAPAFLGGCHKDEDVKPGTIFFNLSHEDFANRTYFLTGGGKTYQLTKVSDDPDVLARARRTNTFLRNVPDRYITHHIEGTVFATDTVSLAYLSSDISKQDGTWSMSGVFVQLPQSAMRRAFEGARVRTPAGPLPLSPKREAYGIQAAQTEQDLREEQVLLDTNAQAVAILTGGPDLFSLDAGTAAHIQTNHLDTDTVRTLARGLGESKFGPATPEEKPGVTNAIGWGTLTPVLNDSGVPFKNTKGTHAGRIQYIPVFHPDIVGFIGQQVARFSSNVKDDTTIGVDVTQLNPQPGDPPNPALAGMMWARRDGSTSVDLGGAGAGPAQVMTLKQIGPQNGLTVTPTVTATGGQPTVSVLTQNWYVRFLGIYLQFIASDGVTVLKLADIPEYVNGTIIPGHDKAGDTTTDMFISVLGPEFLILGIPAWPGYTTPTFTVPQSAATVRMLAGGLGSGSSNYSDTVLPGAFMTAIVNYGVTALLCAMGAAATVGAITKTVVNIARPLAQELVVLLSAAISGNSAYSAAFWKAQGLAFLKWIITRDVGIYVKQLVEEVVAATVEGIAEDCIPIAGWIMLGISVAVGVATLLETTIEIVESPWTYVNDLVFTHDLSVNLLRDPGNGTFPENADHYVVTALFDDGTPYVQTLPVSGGPATLPPVVFGSVPLGGKVNVSVAFYQQATGSSARLLLGKATTGRVDNDASANPTLTLAEVRYPIDSSTAYEHRQKTALDSNGNHIWDATAPAPTVNAANLVCGTAGTLCNFQGITVRQGTGTQQGYVGYGFEGWTDSSKGESCGGGPPAQFGQLANLNTGSDAQDGYIAGPCGFSHPGVKVAYNLLSHDTANFYLDTSNINALHLRQVMLAPPAFEAPSSSNPQPPSQSWGVLNFMPDALLLHPAGHIVSISSVNHKLETLPIPQQPMDDADALIHLLAQTKCGKGTRPGLVTAPSAAAIAPDGTILVLEAGAPTASPVVPARIQALDIGGNPKQFFGSPPTAYTLELTATPNTAGWQYLDLAVEYGGLIYVLSHLQGTYRLDIYSPAQTGTAPLCTTSGINAAKIAVDFWRNLYALNYEVIPVQGGGTPGFTEPSISLWVPSSSCTGVNCTP